jgi:hypothetical protein
VVPLVYDALLEKCIDVLSHYCLIMIDKVYKLSYHDELQSGPLMVKALTGRRFTD